MRILKGKPALLALLTLIWLLLAVCSVSLFLVFLAPAHGKLFDESPFIDEAGRYISYFIYATALVPLATIFINYKHSSIENNSETIANVASFKSLISGIIFIFGLSVLSSLFWSAFYVPIIGEYAPGNNKLMSGTVKGSREVKTRGQPALQLVFVLDGEHRDYEARFDSTLRGTPWYKLPDFIHWHPATGERAQFTIKKNIFGRTVIHVEPVAGLSNT